MSHLPITQTQDTYYSCYHHLDRGLENRKENQLRREPGTGEEEATGAKKDKKKCLFPPAQAEVSTCIVFGGAELGERFFPVRIPGNARFDRAVWEREKEAESQSPVSER